MRAALPKLETKNSNLVLRTVSSESETHLSRAAPGDLDLCNLVSAVSGVGNETRRDRT